MATREPVQTLTGEGWEVAYVVTNGRRYLLTPFCKILGKDRHREWTALQKKGPETKLFIVPN